MSLLSPKHGSITRSPMIPGYQRQRQAWWRHSSVRERPSITVSVSHPDAELLLIELRLRRSFILCGLLYRPPSSNASTLSTTLEQLPPSKLKSFVLLGDFNIDLSPTSNHPLLPILNSIQDKLGLKQVVDTATRTTSSSSTIIDHIYVSSDLTHSECVNLPPLPGSDHNTLQITLTNRHTPQPKSKSSSKNLDLQKSRFRYCQLYSPVPTIFNLQ